MDPSDLRTTATIRIGGQLISVSTNATGVWVGDTNKPRLIEIDPNTNKIKRTVRVRPSPSSVVATDNARSPRAHSGGASG